MTIFLAIALLIVAPIGTLAAFGGKTWDEKDGKFERVNSRGLISLTCLILTLVVGITKEILSEHQNDKKEVAAITAKAQADKEQDALKAQNELLTLKLDEANRGLGSLKEQLETSAITLSDMRGNLKAAQDDVNREGHLGLITAIARANQYVRYFKVTLPLTSSGNRASTFHGVLLPSSSDSSCNNLFAQMDIWTGSLIPSTVDFLFDDSKDKHDHSKRLDPEDNVETDDLIHPVDESDLQFGREIARVTGQLSSNSHAIVINILPPGPAPLAADVLSTLLRTDPYVESFSRITRNMSDNILTISAASTSASIPKACVKPIRNYFNVAFDKASFTVAIGKDPTINVYFTLKKIEELDKLGEPKAVFRLYSKPLVAVDSGNDSTFKAPH